MKNQKHNLLMIMTDQFRHDYLGSAGAAFAQTPSLDRLAASGIRFTNCCTNAPLCAPARIALASGLQPARLGALDNNSYLPNSAPSYYRRLRDHGYRVGCTGKLDIGKPERYIGRNGDRPCAYGWGFTHPVEIEGKMSGGGYPEPIGPYGHYLQDKGLYKAFYDDYQRRDELGWHINAAHDSVLPAEDFADSYIGERALQWLRGVDQTASWHLFVSFVGPHDPFDPPAEFADRFRDKPMPDPIPRASEGKPAWVQRRQKDYEPEAVAVSRRQYCAAIAAIDTQVGRILDTLEETGMADNTIIVFASDHGEMLGDLGLYRKTCPYEASIRVPLVVSGPGIAPSRTSDALVELIDINPTLCELAGLPRQPNIDGQSFAPILRSETVEHRAETVFGLRNFRGIRTREWKFAESMNDADELYNLVDDPTESRNLAEQEPARVSEMRKRMVERFMEGKWNR